MNVNILAHILYLTLMVLSIISVKKDYNFQTLSKSLFHMLGLSFVYWIFFNNKHNIQCNKTTEIHEKPITIARFK